MRKNNKSLKIKAFTWSKDSHGLFDYETPHLTIHRGFCKQNLHLYRFDKDVVFLDPKSKNPTSDFTSLCNINVTEDGRFTVSSKDDSAPVMLVIRSMKSAGKQKGYELTAGDRVKIGRVEYYVREVRNQDGVVQKATDPLLCLNYNKGMDIEEKDDEKRYCRICYSEESAEEKGVPEIKFLTPCKCKGTSQYLHFSCLSDWLESKRQSTKTNMSSLQNQPTMNENILAQIQNYFVSTMGPHANDASGITSILNEINPFNSNSTSLAQEEAGTQQSPIKTYFFSNFCCDVCKEVLPFSIITNKGNEYETVDIPRPGNEPYILFERLSQGKDPKTFSIITGPSEQEVKIGRGFNSEIVVSDISVSRFHAYIKYQNGRFYLFDKNSKFGTLVQLKEPLEIHKEKIGIQSGRTLITFSVQEERVREEAAEMTESVTRISEMSKVTPQSSKKPASQIKKGQSLKKTAMKKDNRDGGSEGTVDVDEGAPVVNKELNSRSKKINKRGSRAVENRPSS